MTKQVKHAVTDSPQMPLKKIRYQELDAMSELLDQLASWQGPLNVLGDFFADKQRPINKKKVVRDYHACSQLFNLFQEDFERDVHLIETQLTALKIKEKLPYT